MAKINFIVTGGLGFIGSRLVQKLWTKYYGEAHIFIFDKMGTGSIADIFDDEIYKKSITLIKCDIKNADELTEHSKQIGDADCIFHLAAESHVDRSIDNPVPFLESNVNGTFNMLFCFKNKFQKFIHVSTDEVYGSLNPNDNESTEQDMLNPSSIYSSTKASSDLIVQSAFHTYKMPVLITRCCNNFGPFQHDEKFIPTIIRNAFHDNPIPVYGDGKNMREWIYVSDHVNALIQLYKKGKIGEIYNIGSRYRIDNIKMVKNILFLMNKPESLISFVKDRPGHDICYKLNSNKIRKIVGLPLYDDQYFLSLLEETLEIHLKAFKYKKEKKHGII